MQVRAGRHRESAGQPHDSSRDSPKQAPGTVPGSVYAQIHTRTNFGKTVGFSKIGFGVPRETQRAQREQDSHRDTTKAQSRTQLRIQPGAPPGELQRAQREQRAQDSHRRVPAQPKG